MANYTHAIFAAYRDTREAEQTVQMLLASGLPATDISVVGRDPQTQVAAEDAEAGEASEIRLLKGEQHEGAVAGAWIGGIGGLLVGFGLFLVPGIGPLVAFGPLAGLLYGTVRGGLWGWEFGAASFIDEAAHHRELLIQGKVLVVVHSTTEAEAKQARSLLQQTNPDNLDTVSYAVKTETEKEVAG